MNSSVKESPQPRRNLHDSRNMTTILPPEITSTPFISSKTKIPSPLVTPTRKFSGPRRYALSNNGMLNPVKTIRDPPGPLLASTAYNINVSTYIDTKSPGYAGRLVQYNEESTRKQQQTHQEKYGSPGLLPIVHLFKKDVPVISPKLKKGTIRIGTPESRGYYSQEHNRMLLEGIVRNNSILKEQNNSNEVSTRSVLDALKEISRKRIHANEEYDPMDDNNKKFRKADGDGDYSKRNRVDSPPSENTNSSPTSQAKKRLCTIDAVLASKTSSMYAFEGGTKRKSREDTNNRIIPMNKKKYNNVETQTFGTPVVGKETKIIRVSDECDNDKNEELPEKTEVIEEICYPPKQVLKVLDDKPLEVIRKNRLGALLSALSGREIPSIPMEDRRKALDQEWPSQTLGKPLVSILSSQNKQTKSPEKHVTFNLIQSSQSCQSTSSTAISETSSGTNQETEDKDNTNTAQKEVFSSKSSTEKTSVDDEQKTTNVLPKPDNNMLNTFSPNSKLDAAKTNTEEKEKSVGGFKFDLSKPVNIPSSISTTPQITKIAEVNSKKEIKSPGISFSPSSTGLSSLPMFATPSSKPESKPVFESSTNSPSMAPTTNSLGLPTSLPIPNSLTASITNNTSSPFTFGTKPASEVTSEANNKTTGVFTFGKKEASQSESGNSSTSTSLSSITAPTSAKVDSSGTITSPFGSKTVASVGSASPAFPFNSMNNISTIAAKSSNVPITCSSVTISTISNAPSFNSASTVSAMSSASVLGGIPNSIFTPKTFSTIAGTSESTKTNLGTSAKSPPGGFKFNPGSSLPSFGSPSVSSVLTQASSSTLNAFSSQANTTAPSPKTQVENLVVTSNPFVSAPASSSMFGNGSVPNTSFTSDKKPFTFGSSGDDNNSVTSSNATSAFTFKAGQSITTTDTSASTASKLPFGSTAPTFGTTNNMFSPAKSTPVPSFGAPTTASSFGTSNSFTFGSKPKNTGLNTPSSTTSLFSATNTSSLGTTTTPSFGTTTASSFGTTNTPSFGTSSTTTFGTTNTPSFGTSSTPKFGSTNTPAFGATNTPAFGSTNTPAFGATNPPAFGATNPPAFGATNTPSFGSSVNTPSFGTTTSTSGFGTTNTPSFSTANTSNTFGSTNTPTFGTSSTPSFGSTNTPNFGSTNAPSFGNNNTPTFGTTNTPAFGANNITSTKNNAFGGTSTAVPAFGTNTPSFGTSKTIGFGTTNTPTFGSSTSTSGIGSSFASPSMLNAPSFGNPSSPFGNAVANNTNTFNSNNASSPFGNTSSTNSFGTFNSNNNQAAAAPGFGTSTNNSFGNSSATNAFGGGTSATNAFGSSSTSSPFGANANSTAPNAFVSSFGKKPEQSSSIFPTSANNMFNNTAGFGAASNNNTGGNPTSGVFAFGSSNTNAPSSSGVFTFGATEPPKTFNFNAPVSSDSAPTPSGSAFNPVPSFAQPGPAVPNMFSIGSGNTAAPQGRSRPLVRARRRT